ncbi:mannose binding [Mactra antiquata]
MCRDVIGGYLVEIHDADENAFLEQHARAAYSNFWIGLSDREREGVWKWMTSHTPLSGGFRDWARGEPNSLYGDEDCASIYIENYSHWVDAPCDAAKFHYICEKSLW